MNWPKTTAAVPAKPAAKRVRIKSRKLLEAMTADPTSPSHLASTSSTSASSGSVSTQSLYTPSSTGEKASTENKEEKELEGSSSSSASPPSQPKKRKRGVSGEQRRQAPPTLQSLPRTTAREGEEGSAAINIDVAGKVEKEEVEGRNTEMLLNVGGILYLFFVAQKWMGKLLKIMFALF
jgi:hypothetical protein